jgi:hypothetical protein
MGSKNDEGHKQRGGKRRKPPAARDQLIFGKSRRADHGQAGGEGIDRQRPDDRAVAERRVAQQPDQHRTAADGGQRSIGCRGGRRRAAQQTAERETQGDGKHGRERQANQHLANLQPHRRFDVDHHHIARQRRDQNQEDRPDDAE